MSKKKLLKATHGSDKTPLVLGNMSIPCYVLEDGTRVFSGRGIQRALGANPNVSGTWLSKFVNSSPLTPFIDPGIIALLNNPIPFQRPNASGSQSSSNGYEVTVLIDLCDSILKANKSRGSVPSDIVDNAELIIRSVAKVGIIALVDEVTGYQHDREKDELQKILKAYISQELLPWQKRFPDIFYKELFRLNDWDFTVKGIKKRPGVIGKWTKTLIYEQLPPGVLEDLQKKTPKNTQLHRMLTLDVGEPNLSAQIQQVVTLFQLSDNMQHMWQQFEKLKHRQSGQLELPFSFDENGHTVAPEEPIQEAVNLSHFNQSLKKAIDNGKGTN